MTREPPPPENTIDDSGNPVCPVCGLPIPPEVSVGMRDGRMFHIACWLVEPSTSPARDVRRTTCVLPKRAVLTLRRWGVLPADAVLEEPSAGVLVECTSELAARCREESQGCVLSNPDLAREYLLIAQVIEAALARGAV